jgi:hypothetical protein
MTASPGKRQAPADQSRRALALSLTPPPDAPSPARERAGSVSAFRGTPGSQALALPGLAAWSLLFRRKALLGNLRSWSLNSRPRLR